MEGKDPIRRLDSITDQVCTDRVSVPREWQFSLRSVLLVTTVASICLAIGTNFVGVALAAFVLVLLQVVILVILFSVDWLIRRTSRRMLAFVAAGSWIVLGSGLLIVSFSLAYGRQAAGDRSGVWIAIMFITLTAPVCYWFAWSRWKRFTALCRANL
jgi:hypothetical protein